jgi:hypothetical protein
LAFALCLGVAACASTASEALCTDGRVSVDVVFEAAGAHTCLEATSGRFVLSVTPEGRPINPSPWYAFRMTATGPSRVSVTLRYDEARHRYHPEVSRDGRSWRSVAASDVAEDGASATISLDLERGVTFVAAQPIETPATTLAWSRRLLLPVGFRQIEYGRSVEGRPLVAFVHGEGAALVVAITRQHPPETQGALAFKGFVERIAAGDDAARTFRANHRLVLAPMTNPDGVVRGHWRHNAGGVDLNRDWGSLSQPETRALAALLEREAADRRVRSFIDFHSTYRNVVYAPPQDAPSPDIAFLAALEVGFRADLTSPPVWEYNHNANSGVSKAWALERLGAPGITLEVADTATSEEARAIGRAAADALIAYANSKN